MPIAQEKRPFFDFSIRPTMLFPLALLTAIQRDFVFIAGTN